MTRTRTLFCFMITGWALAFSTAAVWLYVGMPHLRLAVSSSAQPISKDYSESISEDYSKVVSELLDQRHAVTVLPREAFFEGISIPASAINMTIDRKSLLTNLFARVTAGQPTDQLRIEAWVRYIQNRVAHVYKPLLLDNGQAIYDPYWILKNRIGQCGQINRVIVDGLSAVGFKARVVQLKGHVAAEVWHEGAWRYLDADFLNFGQFVRHDDGSLASAEEIHKNRNLLNGLMPNLHLQFKIYPINNNLEDFDPYDVFSDKPYYYIKTATTEQEKNEYFGWNYYETIFD